jgi:hypothetical protein
MNWTGLTWIRYRSSRIYIRYMHTDKRKTILSLGTSRLYFQHWAFSRMGGSQKHVGGNLYSRYLHFLYATGKDQFLAFYSILIIYIDNKAERTGRSRNEMKYEWVF